MTKQPHPITPPPELVQQWCHEDGDEPKTSTRWFYSVCAKAARWGADQELEACCEWLRSKDILEPAIDALRTARRPKPPTLKEQALGIIDDNIEDGPSHISFALEEIKTIRRALEALDD